MKTLSISDMAVQAKKKDYPNVFFVFYSEIQFLNPWQVEDDKIIIPRNSLVEVNQSGLLMETLIDITPKDPLPSPSAGPLDSDCSKEGLIVCDKERIRGQEGVSLDALVGIFTRLGREMEEIGVKRSYALAEKVASIVQEAQPLISKVKRLFHVYCSQEIEWIDQFNIHQYSF